MNGVTGAVVPRALVQLGSRSILTDAEGRFRFDLATQPVSSLRFLEPGFAAAPEESGGSADGLIDGNDPASLTLFLWPEAVLTGTVRTQSDEPLPRISVIARRSVFDERGHHLQVAGQRQTDSHGEFRIPVPAGDYSVETQFSPSGFERDQAVLPVAFPPSSVNEPVPTFHVNSGEEQRIDLRPRMAATHTVTLPLESGDGPPPRISAVTTNGTSFTANAGRSQDPGSVRLNLPSGTYSLHATRFDREGMLFGESAVTVPEHDIAGPMLHLASLPGVLVELTVDLDAASASSTGPSTSAANPTLPMFNISLDAIEPDPLSPTQSSIRAIPLGQRSSNTAVLAAPPGLYRLSASAAGGWYIRSATSGGADLMVENIVIAPGASHSPIAIVVSNQTGTLQGTVKLAGQPAACWIYLIANGPALPAVLSRRSSSAGTFSFTDVPPGSFRVIAFPFRHSANLQDPAVLNSFASHVSGASITPGNTTNLDLDCVTPREMNP